MSKSSTRKLLASAALSAGVLLAAGAAHADDTPGPWQPPTVADHVVYSAAIAIKILARTALEGNVDPVCSTVKMKQVGNSKRPDYDAGTFACAFAPVLQARLEKK